MFGWPLPAFFDGNHVAMGLMQLLLSGIIMVINQKFFVSGFRSLFHRAPNMDTLIALGSAAAFGYSTVMLFAMTHAQVRGGADAAMAFMDEFYFESAAMILTLITVGKMLEAYSKGKTTNALKSLLKLAPKTANVLRDGKEVTVPVEEVGVGDVFVVRPGENIPVDAVVLEGTSAVNEAALTGESIPVDKQAGDSVSSATLNQSGFLKCRATRVGEDTTLSQIIQMVSDAAATKAPVAKLADTISGYFVPAVIGIAALTLAIWLLVGAAPGYALARAICVLVVSCPCALGLATPVAIMVGNGVGAKNGVLFKNAEALQETGNVQIVCLDKTGTITSGEPRVTDLIPADGVKEELFLQQAAALEEKSEHPLARAVTAYGKEKGVDSPEVSDFTALPGNGLKGKIGLDTVVGGSFSYIETLLELPESAKASYEKLTTEGKTPLFFAVQRYERPKFPHLAMTQAVSLKAQGETEGLPTWQEIIQAAEAADQVNSPEKAAPAYTLLGIIAVADTIREDSAEAIAQLKAQGIHVVMLTGDNERTAQAIGRKAGVDEVIAGVLPDGKEEIVRRLQESGRVAMVGDGINDAPALTRAQIGIAIGAGTDVAIDAADVVLMKSRLLDVAAAVRLSRATYRNIIENLFWALIYNTLLIPLAAGAYAHLFGLTMNPMLGAAAMSLSSVCVVSNALRLNLIKLYDASKDRPRKDTRRPVAASSGEGKVLSLEAEEGKKDNQQGEKSAGGSSSAAGAENKEEKGKTGGNENMTKTMKINGMMCEHCEANVKKALEALPFVESAEVSHTAGTAVVTISGEADEAAMRQAVEAKDYEVTAIE